MSILQNKKNKTNFTTDDLKNRKDLMLIQNDQEFKMLAAKSVEFCEKYLGVIALEPGDTHAEECMIIAMGACIVLGFDFYSNNEDVDIKLRKIKKQIVPSFKSKFILKKI